MSEKPAPLNNSTSTDLLPEESPGTEKDKRFTPVLHQREASRLRRIIGDLILLLAILILLTWPWVFFGVVRTKTKHHLNNKLFEDIHNENYLAATQRVLNADLSGLRAGHQFADFYMNHRSTATFVITLIATLASILVGKVFSLSVRRFTQEWVSEKKELQVFSVVLISGFRSKNFPWHLHDFNKHLFGKNRWLAIVTVGAYLGAMTVVTSSVTSLLTPINIILHEGLTASELDFSANASECLQWFSDTDGLVNNGTCGWQKFEDLTYNICLGQRQMLDALEAGQGQILGSLSGQAENVTFTKISDRINLRFAGQVRGVLPGGPDGVFSLSIGQNSSVADVVAESDVMSYNYTLLQQGLNSQVSCQYANDSPIGFRSFEGSDVISRSTGNCSSVGAIDFADDPDLTSAVEVNAANLLAYWACQAKPQSGQPPSYLLYFQGQTNYSSTIGNITCTVSPLQPATFPVEFESVAGSFFVGQQIDSTKFSSTEFPEDLLFAIGDIVSSAQNFQSNLLADIVIESGVKYHELSSTARDPAYPDLFASLIQGIMDYEATYNRLIYSASVPQAPPSCTRPIDGWFSYQVIGWNVTIKHVFLLIPMTIVNLASLVMMLSVLFIAKGTTDPEFDPTDARQLIYAKHGVAETPDEWEDRVVYLPREASGQTAYHWT